MGIESDILHLQVIITIFFFLLCLFLRETAGFYSTLFQLLHATTYLNMEDGQKERIGERDPTNSFLQFIPNKLLTELRCRNFVNKHRLSTQIGPKRAKTRMQCAYIPTELPFCVLSLVVGERDSTFLIFFPDGGWRRKRRRGGERGVEESN